MRIKSKRIRVIEMTIEEMDAFQATMEKARQGQQVNYAETKLTDGSYLGVAIDPTADRPEPRYPEQRPDRY